MLRSRIISASIALPLFCAAILFAPPVIWALLLAVVVTAGGSEWGRLCGFRAPLRWCYALAMGIPLGIIAVTASGQADEIYMDITVIAATAFWVLLAPVWLRERWKPPILGSAALGSMVLLATWVSMVRLHADPPVLLTFLGIAWVSDTGAYFAGRSWGRRKLAPQISPGKTWEGVAGGLITVAIYYLIVYKAFFDDRLAWGMFTGLVVFLFAGLLGIVGDLLESLLKRQAGVKDSGTIMPGHGGILDRIDSLTASMPFLALAAQAGLLK